MNYFSKSAPKKTTITITNNKEMKNFSYIKTKIDSNRYTKQLIVEQYNETTGSNSIYCCCCCFLIDHIFIKMNILKIIII